MAIALTNIASNASSSNPGTLSITVPTGGVPSGALIVACSNEYGNNASLGSFSDTAGNSYATITQAFLNNTQSIGQAGLFYAYNVAALNSGDSITFTAAASGDNLVIGAIYATGIISASDPLDSAATNSATGSSATPSLTSGTPGTANDLFVASLAWGTTSTIFTEDGTDGWSLTGTSQPRMAGLSTLVATDQLSKTFAPTLAGSRSWAALVAAFQPAASGDTLMGQAVM